MRLRVAGLWRHPKSKMFWFRMGVPERYRARVGKREWKESLGTADEVKARFLHARKLVEVHDLMRALDAASAIDIDDQADKIVADGFDALARANIKAHEVAADYDMARGVDHVCLTMLQMMAFRARLDWGGAYASKAQLEALGEADEDIWPIEQPDATGAFRTFAHRDAVSINIDLFETNPAFNRIDAAAELALDDATDWDVAALSRWLDRTTRQRDVSQPIFLEYCRRVVEGVVERIPLAQLVRGKFALRRAIIAKIVQQRREAGMRGVQLLMTDIAPVLALGDNGFSFSKAGYDPRTPYSGPWRPRKHLFAQVGDLRHGGEEWMAAVQIDDHEAVKHWVRNVDRTAWSYSLPTSTDMFYPDFVAELQGGRNLIVEYKGADRTDNADSREKKNIGARLQEVSDGKVIFLWAELDRGGGVARQIDAAIG